ncbi:MAG: 30S ribosomal protein S17, partial [bacterium]|nr:30S ribosomal protein S17 [bacterium]
MMTLKGKVIAMTGTNTVRVEVSSFIEHPKYKKRLARTSGFLVHDTIGVKLDDMVKFCEVRPL